MNPTKKFYPNANSTMRMTYGSVGDYEAADAIKFNYFTTLDGVMQKEDASNPEFVVHPKLKELWKNKDYGKYGENGVMKVCYLTDNDITGGNSGSPVMDGYGNLVGLAFDGNWEGLSGSYYFEPNLTKTINVDIRYVLFIIDKFAGATNLIKEMKIVE
jgi:V8-like Glu-specific endopeptidase